MTGIITYRQLSTRLDKIDKEITRVKRIIQLQDPVLDYPGLIQFRLNRLKQLQKSRGTILRAQYSIADKIPIRVVLTEFG